MQGEGWERPQVGGQRARKSEAMCVFHVCARLSPFRTWVSGSRFISVSAAGSETSDRTGHAACALQSGVRSQGRGWGEPCPGQSSVCRPGPFHSEGSAEGPGGASGEPH